MKRYHIKLCIIVASICIAIFNITESFANDLYKGSIGESKNILCVVSFHSGFTRTDEVVEEIRSSILESGKNINLIVNYMDAKRNNDENFLELQQEYFYQKYKNQDIDAVIAIEQDALDMVSKNKEKFSDDIPIIAAAIDIDNEKYIDSNYNIYGVYNSVQIQSTIELALNLNRELENIIFINSDKDNSEIIVPDKVKMVNINKIEIYDIIDEINSYNVNSIVIPIGDMYKNNILLDELNAIEYISNNINIPMYSLWGYQIGHGVLGGDVISGTIQGQRATKMLFGLLYEEYSYNLENEDNKFKDYLDENTNFTKRHYGMKIADTYMNSKYIIDNDILERFHINNKLGKNTYILINSFVGNPYGDEGIRIIILITIALELIIIIIYSNKSRRDKVKEGFKDREERLSVLINATPDIIAFKDGEGRWLDCNKSAREILDIKSDSEYLMKTNLQMAENNKDKETYFINFEKSDKIAWMNKKIFKSEVILPDIYGVNKIYETVKIPLFEDNNKRKALVVLGRDVTSRRMIQSRLEQSEKRYENLINTLPGAIIMYLNEKIIFISKTAVEMLGAKSYRDLVGSDFKNIFYGGFDRRNLFDNINKLKNKEGNTLNIEETLNKCNGEKFQAVLSFMTFKQEGKMNIAVMITDMTEANRNKELQKTIEENNRLLLEEKEYSKIKTEFFSNISHELRTPINVMFSSIQLLQLYNNNGQIVDETGNLEKRLNVLRQNSYRLLRLVNNIIDITRIDSGFLGLNLGSYNIVEVIEDITDSVADYIEDKGLTLIFDTEIEEKTMIFDPEKIERVMLNLLANSVKFTERGGTILVTIRDIKPNIEISVKDTGIGIPESKKEIIFDRFRQVDKSLTRAKEGSGIGLSLVKSLVNMHGGRVMVKSELGKGSEFIVNLPVRLDKGIKSENITNQSSDDRVQKINLEFSDIYT